MIQVCRVAKATSSQEKACNKWSTFIKVMHSRPIAGPIFDQVINGCQEHLPTMRQKE